MGTDADERTVTDEGDPAANGDHGRGSEHGHHHGHHHGHGHGHDRERVRGRASGRPRPLSALPGSLGLGSAPLGNMFRAVRDDEAAATVEAAWDAGFRYFDTAPSYGAGQAELRLGSVLAARPRDEYAISTKVGRIVLDEVRPPAPGLFQHGRPNRVVNDYSTDGTLRSIEDSLTRLGVDRIDVLWVHDLAPNVYGDEWIARFEEARTGAFRVLDRLRDEGVVTAWGVATNPTEPIELVLSLTETRPDAFLLAGSYTLLDHEHALGRLLPLAAAQGVDMVVGGPYNSGVLAGGATFEYQTAPPDIVERVGRLRAIAAAHGVSIKAAALQFCLAHPVTAAVIPGASQPDRVRADAAALAEPVPPDFWAEIRAAGLISPAAPTPGTDT